MHDRISMNLLWCLLKQKIQLRRHRYYVYKSDWWRSSLSIKPKTQPLTKQTTAFFAILCSPHITARWDQMSANETPNSMPITYMSTSQNSAFWILSAYQPTLPLPTPKAGNSHPPHTQGFNTSNIQLLKKETYIHLSNKTNSSFRSLKCRTRLTANQRRSAKGKMHLVFLLLYKLNI